MRAMGGITQGSDLRTRCVIPDPTRSGSAPTQIGAASVAATPIASRASRGLGAGADSRPGGATLTRPGGGAWERSDRRIVGPKDEAVRIIRDGSVDRSGRRQPASFIAIMSGAYRGIGQSQHGLLGSKRGPIKWTPVRRRRGIVIED